MPGGTPRKLAVVGGRSVGKSSLISVFCTDNFDESYFPTIDNTYQKDYTFKGKGYDMEIADTQGQDEYSILNSKHFMGVHGYMIVYSVTSKQSFDMISVIRDKILNHLGDEWVPMTIVGNKVDLAQSQRQVPLERGQKLAEEFKCGFVEASARSKTNVNGAFENLLAECNKKENPNEPTNSKGCAVM